MLSGGGSDKNCVALQCSVVNHSRTVIVWVGGVTPQIEEQSGVTGDIRGQGGVTGPLGGQGGVTGPLRG